MSRTLRRVSMQRFAFSLNGERVFADDAIPQVDYFCPECREKLRVKQGDIKIPHFFHFEGTKECRWKTRFQTHSIIQEEFVQKLGAENCTLECFFPGIARIADIAYYPKKVVFEIQVSPISRKELEERTCDYWKAGWHIIWILHINQFGSKKASGAEELAEGVPHYFTDIGSNRGALWDEASFVSRGRRRFFSPLSRKFLDIVTPTIHGPLPKALASPQTFISSDKWLEYRHKNWSCSLLGDFLTEGNLSTLSLPSKLPSSSEIFPRLRSFFFLLWIKISGSV